MDIKIVRISAILKTTRICVGIALLLDLGRWIDLSYDIKVIMVIVLFLFFIFGTSISDKTEQTAPIKEKNPQKSQAIFFSKNEYIEIVDQDANQILHKVTISDIYVTNDQQFNTSLETKKLLTIEGKLENISDEIISLSPDKLFVYDKTGCQLSFYQPSESQKIATRISAGRNTAFQYSYLFAGESNDIEIEYVPDSTWKKPAAIWKLTLDEISQTVISKNNQIPAPPILDFARIEESDQGSN